jgi:hypothetical protein
MDAPTNTQLLDEDGVNRVSRVTDDSWQHGCYVTEVFHRLSDATFWMACYRRSTDGETHELREGRAQISRVWPKTITKVVYTTEEPKFERELAAAIEAKEVAEHRRQTFENQLNDHLQKLVAKERELTAAKERVRELEGWLNSKTTYYDVDTEDRQYPVLADLSRVLRTARIWYHATDDTSSYPFSEVIDRALKSAAPKEKMTNTEKPAATMPGEPHWVGILRRFVNGDPPTTVRWPLMSSTEVVGYIDALRAFAQEQVERAERAEREAWNAALKHAAGTADTIISEIIREIRSRNGLRQEWVEIDVDDRNEIARKWRAMIKQEIEREAGKEAT